MIQYMCDFETSYINKEQRKVFPEKDRERYVDSAIIMSTEDEQYTIFNDGEITLQNFLNHLIALVKVNSKITGKNSITVGFHNLKYDWHYIVYHLNMQGCFTDKKLHSFSYDEINDGNTIYGATLTFSYRNKGYKKKQITVNGKKKYGDYILDENGEKIPEFRNYTIHLIDTLKLFPFSVEKLGETIGVKKLKKNFKYNKIRSYIYRLRKREEKYLIHDVLITTRFYNSMPEYMKERLTIGSCALNWFKNNCFPMTVDGKVYDKFEYLFPNNSKPVYGLLNGVVNYDIKYTIDEINSIVMNQYTGGVTQINPIHKGKLLIWKGYKDKNRLICECIKQGREYIITDNQEEILDVNSLYPFIMRYGKMPYGVPIVIEYPSKKELNKLAENHYIIIDLVDVYGSLKENKLPTVPKSKYHKIGADVLYKQSFYGENLSCSYDEFTKLHKEHYNIETYTITRAIVYKTIKGELFTKYIDYFTDMKIAHAKKLSNGEPNPNYSEIKRTESKLMLNNLYGKCGTNINKVNFINKYINGWIKEIKENGRKQEYIYPPVASAVTSYARIYMFSIIDKIPYHNFIYMDTDSIHFIPCVAFNLNSIKDLIHPTDLGKLDNEDSYKTSIYLAPKKYSGINEKNEIVIKCSGLPEKAKEKINDIIDFYYGYETKTKLQSRKCRGGVDLVTVPFRISKTGEQFIENCICL